MKKIFLMFLFLFQALAFASPPSAEEIFQLSAKREDPNTFILNWSIKPGYFLYKDKIQLQPKGDKLYKLGKIRFPKPLSKTNNRGEEFEIYRLKLSLPVPVLGEAAGEDLITVHYQGCSDDGFCYPPQAKEIKLSFDKDLALVNAEHGENATGASSEAEPKTQVDEVLSSNSLLWIIPGFLGFGFLLSFTPCVLPMIPVLSGIIVGQGKELSTRKAFLLSLSYVLSMSLTYALVGAVVALMGNNLQIFMQSPWVIGALGLIFVVLALSMFNFYELRMPVSWQSKLASVTRSQSGGHYLGAAIMGCVSTLVLSPCVTAPLIGVIGYIAHTGNIGFGSTALFFLGLGMGLPLLFIGTSAGKLLPKAGSWMNTVKAFFGVLLLALAIYLLERILPQILSMALWAGLLIFCGVFIGAFNQAKSNLDKLNQGAGIMLLVYGLLILIGASQGNTNPLLPLKNSSDLARTSRQSSPQVVTTVKEAQKALAEAKGTPVMLDFYADWCTSCKVIAATTLKNPAILQELENIIVVKVDLTSNDQNTRELLKHFNVVAPPTFLFYDRNGRELSHLRVIGEASTEAFIRKLNTIKF